MSQRFLRHIFFAQAALLLSLSLCMSACRGRTEEELTPSDPSGYPEQNYTGAVVYSTDSTAWVVYVFRSGVLASEEISVPEPYHIPTHEEASVLRHITYGASGQRYLTDDGYTFGMPSASVSKAGQKTKYSVMGLYIRPTVIRIEF